MSNIEAPKYNFCPHCGGGMASFVDGENRDRQMCSKCNWHFFPAVSMAVAAIIEKDNSVLMVQRNREPYKGTWMFPSGFVEYGEHPDIALAREVEEETGLAVVEFGLFRILQETNDPRSPGNMVFYYRVKTTGELKNNDKDENISFGWKSLAQTPKIGFASHGRVFEELKKRPGTRIRSLLNL